MIDVLVERALFFSWAHEDGVDANHPAPFAYHADLSVTDVAVDIVIPAHVRVRHDRRLGCHREDLFKPSRVDVRKINNYAERFALMHDFATERCQSLSRRAARRENSAMPRRI